MRKIVILSVGLFCGFIFATASLAAQTLTVDPQQSNISFLAKSTLHDIDGTANGISGYLDVDQTQSVFNAHGEMYVPVGMLDTNNKKRDRNMRQMFDEKMFPQVICQIYSLEIKDFIKGQENSGHLKGSLIIKDIARPLDIDVVVVQAEDGIFIKGNTGLSLKEYSLRPPSVLGVIRVSDEVSVDFLIKLIKGKD